MPEMCMTAAWETVNPIRFWDRNKSCVNSYDALKEMWEGCVCVCVCVLEMLNDSSEGRGVEWKDGLTDGAGGEEKMRVPKVPHIHPVQ